MKRALLSIGAGALGFLLAWSGWHLYLDHKLFHQLVDFAVAQANAQKAQPK